MCSTTGGYIGIQKKSINFKELQKIEAQLMVDLTAFRTEKFALYLFINTLWIIISTVVLKYTADLLKIPIYLPAEYKNCGVEEDDYGNGNFLLDDYFNQQISPAINSTFDIGYGDYSSSDDDGMVVMYLQPFSLFFLFFYIILIGVQFICMLWHRKGDHYCCISTL